MSDHSSSIMSRFQPLTTTLVGPLARYLGLLPPDDAQQEGFWGSRNANIHFCEPAYVRSPYIAEFWNTLTNLFPLLLGIFGMIWTARMREKSRVTSDKIASRASKVTASEGKNQSSTAAASTTSIMSTGGVPGRSAEGFSTPVKEAPSATRRSREQVQEETRATTTTSSTGRRKPDSSSSWSMSNTSVVKKFLTLPSALTGSPTLSDAKPRRPSSWRLSSMFSSPFSGGAANKDAVVSPPNTPPRSPVDNKDPVVSPPNTPPRSPVDQRVQTDTALQSSSCGESSVEEDEDEMEILSMLGEDVDCSALLMSSSSVRNQLDVDGAITTSTSTSTVIKIPSLRTCDKAYCLCQASWVSFMLMGIGSGLFHATQSFWAELCDELGLNLMLVCFLASQVDSTPPLRTPGGRRFALVYNPIVVLICVLIYLSTNAHAFFTFYFTVQVAVCGYCMFASADIRNARRLEALLLVLGLVGRGAWEPEMWLCRGDYYAYYVPEVRPVIDPLELYKDVGILDEANAKVNMQIGTTAKNGGALSAFTTGSSSSTVVLDGGQQNDQEQELNLIIASTDSPSTQMKSEWSIGELASERGTASSSATNLMWPFSTLWIDLLSATTAKGENNFSSKLRSYLISPSYILSAMWSPPTPSSPTPISIPSRSSTTVEHSESSTGTSSSSTRTSSLISVSSTTRTTDEHLPLSTTRTMSTTSPQLPYELDFIIWGHWIFHLLMYTLFAVSMVYSVKSREFAARVSLKRPDLLPILEKRSQSKFVVRVGSFLERQVIIRAWNFGRLMFQKFEEGRCKNQ
ncbi:unnamed protein product [Amoebophrya sp. A25]|nr:unnamed protein product [Amoebophrya sp. A25]|eukprot:GSA25T00009209001.1